MRRANIDQHVGFCHFENGAIEEMELVLRWEGGGQSRKALPQTEAGSEHKHKRSNPGRAKRQAAAAMRLKNPLKRTKLAENMMRSIADDGG